MDKIVHIKDEEIKSLGLNYIEDWGSFNKMPEPYIEITEKQFYSYWDLWAWSYKDFRQICRQGDLDKIGWKGYFDITIYFYGASAYGRAKKFNGKEYEYKYFRFGCEHDWKVTNTSKCYVKSVCTKCGSEWEVDSSD